MKSGLVRGVLAGVLALAAVPAAAQSYPTKPIRVVIPYAAGGFTDVSLRRITAAATTLGQPIVVENRPGAGTMLGTQAVIDATPDGYTLGFITSAVTQGQTQLKAWNIDPMKQLAPITAVISLPVVLFSSPSKYPNVRTIGDFIAAAKAAPNPVIFGSSGGSDVLPMAMFRSMAGIRMEIVNFKGEGNVKLAVQRGDADLGSASLGAVRGDVTAGTYRALAVTGLSRSSVYPDTPTVDEAGVKGYEFVVWSGFVAPPGTPRDIITTLNRAFVAATRSPDVSKWILDGGNAVIANAPEQFAQMIAADVAKWNRVAKEAGVEPQ